MNQEWNQRRLIHIAPAQVVAARHVIEFIAKVSVAIVEVDMEEQLGESDKPDKRHAAGQK